MTALPTAAPARFVPLAAVAFSDEEQNGQVAAGGGVRVHVAYNQSAPA